MLALDLLQGVAQRLQEVVVGVDDGAIEMELDHRLDPMQGLDLVLQLGLPLQGGRCRSALGGASGNEQCRERTPQRAGVGVVATTWHMRVQA